MRCPGCETRNSVAAKQCSQCGEALKAKPVPLRMKLYGGFGLGIAALAIIGGALVTHIAESEASLSTAVRALGTKTSTPEESNALFVKLDHSLENFLKHHSGMSRDELIKSLQSELPAVGFEVHVSDLPQKLKLVEVDFGLTVYDYLLYTSMEGTKVVPVANLGVFEDGAVMHDQSQPTLVLLGHNVISNVHKPSIKAYSLQIDRSVDETNKVVPNLNAAMLASDGSIKFAENRKDIVLPLVATTVSKPKKGSKHKVATATKTDLVLAWKDGKYSFSSTSGIPEAVAQVATEVKPVEVAPVVPETATTKIAAQTPVIPPVTVPVTSPKSATSEPLALPSANKSTDKTSPKKSNDEMKFVVSSGTRGDELGTGSVDAEYNNVKIRTGPGTGNAIVAQIDKGTAVQIIGKTDCWYKVRSNGQEGYVYAGLIDYDKKDAYKTGTLTKRAKIMDDRSRLLETANSGERLVILPDSSKASKYKVQLANGSVGYLDREAIDQVTSAPTPLASAPPKASRTPVAPVESEPPLVP